jgi:hypothetical protein
MWITNFEGSTKNWWGLCILRNAESHQMLSHHFSTFGSSHWSYEWNYNYQPNVCPSEKNSNNNSLQLLHTPNFMNIGVQNARGGGSWTTNETKWRMQQLICGKNMLRWYRKPIEWQYVQKLISWNQLGFRRKYVIYQHARMHVGKALGLF